MKLILTADLQYRSEGTIRILPAGTGVSLPDSKALLVINAGKARPALPAHCDGCCMEIDGMCFDRIRGISCAVAVHTCKRLEHLGLLH